MHKHWYQNRGWVLGRLILAVGACACAWQSPVIYGSPWGVALWPTAALHIINIPGKAVWQDGEEAELWKMKPRRLHLARGVMPRDTLTGGNTGVHWHFSTAWSMRPINPHEDIQIQNPPIWQPRSFSRLLNHHKWVDARLYSSFLINLLALKWNKRTYVKFLTWTTKRPFPFLSIFPHLHFTPDCPDYSPLILDDSECNEPPHGVFIKLHFHPSLA